MKILTTSFISAIETIFKLVVGLIVVKLITSANGPEGVSRYSQLQNFISIITVLISGASTVGLVKYTSENLKIKNLNKGVDYLKSVITFGLIASSICIVLLTIESENISSYLFGSNHFNNIIYIIILNNI